MEEVGYLWCENFLDYNILYEVHLTDLKFFTWNMHYFFYNKFCFGVRKKITKKAERH